MRTLAALLVALGLAAPAAQADALLDPADFLAASFDGKLVAGEAVALDGDTLMLTLAWPAESAGGVLRVRLWGISAPEMKAHPWGWYARGALDDILAAAGEVSCLPIDRHKNRLVAACWAASYVVGPQYLADPDLISPNREIGRALVAAGWASEYRTFTRGPESRDPTTMLPALARAYAAAEREARTARRGLWRDLPE